MHDSDGNRKIVFDETLASLCLAVQECHSLYAAAKIAGTSYSQAWKKIGFAEQMIGESLFIRRGNQGSSLAPAGQQLLSTYLTLNKQIGSMAHNLFFDFENNIIRE